MTLKNFLGFCFFFFCGRFSFGDSLPFLSLVSISLASGNGLITKEDELESICWEIRVRLFNLWCLSRYFEPYKGESASERIKPLNYLIECCRYDKKIRTMLTTLHSYTVSL